MTAELDLAVVIVNYRTPGLVTDCLATLLPEIEPLAAQVVVVDNASPDDSAEKIAEWLREHDKENRCHLVRSPINGGFSAGNNTGIRTVDARYYLLLNSDTLIRPGALPRLLKRAEAEPQAGLFSPRLEWPDGTPQISCFRFITPVSELLRVSSLGVLGRVFARHEVAMPVAVERMSPPWTSFACVLIRREVFTSVGLLDEGFFMYFEDTEFCHRSRRAGWRIVHEPSVRVVHLRGGTSSVKSAARRRKRLPAYYYRSRSRYFRLCYGRSGLLLANLLWYAGWCLGSMKRLLGRQGIAVCEREWRDIWLGFSHREKLQMMAQETG